MTTRASRVRRGGLVAVGCALALLPATAAAQKHSSPSGKHQVSIRVSDNPIVSGDPVVIFGHLTGPNNGSRKVILWHRINPAPRFTPVQSTQTDKNGFYVFFRPDGVVKTNRNWFVRSSGAQSRTVHERVQSLVTLTGPADGSDLLTGPKHKVTFSGTVSPFTVGDRVWLQRQNADGAGDHWSTIDRGRVQSGGTFTITHFFRQPGDANVRVLVKATRRNIASPSNVLSYQITQAQNPNMTINASADPISAGQSVSITGTLKNGAGQQVTLFAKTANTPWTQVGQQNADSSGNYSFTETPIHNTRYQAKGGGKSSALLFEGVRDVLTADVSSTSVPAGGTVTFSGTVSPDKTGHVIYLQRRNASGSGFHTVKVSHVGPGSVYSISRRLFQPGTHVFRVFIPGGPANQGAASGPFSITVTPASAQTVNTP